MNFRCLADAEPDLQISVSGGTGSLFEGFINTSHPRRSLGYRLLPRGGVSCDTQPIAELENENILEGMKSGGN